MDTDDSKAMNAVSKVQHEGNGMKQQCISQQCCRPMFTAIKDLLVAKAYIKAFENALLWKACHILHAACHYLQCY